MVGLQASAHSERHSPNHIIIIIITVTIIKVIVIINMIIVIIMVMIFMQNQSIFVIFIPSGFRLLMLLTMIMCLHTFVSLFDKYPLASIWDWGLLDDSQRLFTYLQQYDVIKPEI